MRALFIENIEIDDLELTGAKFHHYKNVLRLKKDQIILALNGEGASREFQIVEALKKSFLLKAVSPIKHYDRRHSHNLAIAQLKKDAMDLVFRMSVELGIKEIFILKTEFSQNYNLNLERINTILENAIEQSNSPFKPIIQELDLDSFLKMNKKIAYLSMKNSTEKNVDNFDNYTLLIGPEAGFSSIEDSSICQKIDVCCIHLETNIMRAPTALAAGLGHLLK